jgi:hypothetical protein
VTVSDVSPPAQTERNVPRVDGSGKGNVVEFSAIVTNPQSPRAFVVMQVGEPFDTIYSDLIAQFA